MTPAPGLLARAARRASIRERGAPSAAPGASEAPEGPSGASWAPPCRPCLRAAFRRAARPPGADMGALPAPLAPPSAMRRASATSAARSATVLSSNGGAIATGWSCGGGTGRPPARGTAAARGRAPARCRAAGPPAPRTTGSTRPPAPAPPAPRTPPARPRRPGAPRALPRERIVQRIGQLLDRGRERTALLERAGHLERTGGLVRLLPVRGTVFSGVSVRAGFALGAQRGHAVALPTTGASPADLATASVSPHSTSQLASIR